MDIAEKVLRLKQDFDDVYEAGINSGPSIDENTIIERTVSGKTVILNAVSEVPHEIKVKLTSDTITDFTPYKVTQYGKNLLQPHFNNLTITNKYSPCDVSLSAGVTYTLSALITSNDTNATNCLVYDATNGVTLGYLNRDVRSSVTFTPTKNIARIWIYASNNMVNGDGDTTICSDVQIEIGVYATDYEEYKKPLILSAKADGTVDGVEYDYPFLHLEVENDNIIINVTYHKSYGMQVEYDRFWDSCQQNGKRGNYIYGFAGEGWNDATYNPKYPIECRTHRSNYMFANSLVTDTKVPIIIGSELALSNNIELFYYATNVKTIRELRLESDRVFGNSCFGHCNALVEIRITGPGKIISVANFQWSPLSKESFISVVNALSDTTSGLTATFKKTAKEAAFTEDEWTTLTATKSNWSFLLV